MMDEMGHRLLFLYNHNHVESIHNPHSSSIQWPETKHSPWVNWVLGMNDEFSKQCFHLHKQEQVILTYYYLSHTFHLPFILKWKSSHALVLPKISLAYCITNPPWPNITVWILSASIHHLLSVQSISIIVLLYWSRISDCWYVWMHLQPQHHYIPWANRTRCTDRYSSHAFALHH